MSWRKILVPIEVRADAAGPAIHALEIARALGAHVEFFHPGLDPIEALSYLGDNMLGPMADNVLAIAGAEATGRVAMAQAAVASLMAEREVPTADVPQPGFSARFVTEAGRLSDVALRRLRAADLVVVGRPEHGGPQPILLELALMASGRPVLVTPPGDGPVRGAPMPRRVALAWNGSLEATRALAEGMPLFARAAEVKVLAMGAVDTGPRLADAVDFLRWHDIAAVGETLPEDGPSLLDAVVAQGLDLLVMGAYTHSRIHQLVLGGVTRDVLARAAIPILMAH